MNIKLYTIPTCGKCNVIKIKLAAKGIDFEVCDDIDEMQKLGILGVPVMSIDGVLEHDVNKINDFVNSL